MADPVLERLPAFRSHKIVRAAEILDVVWSKWPLQVVVKAPDGEATVQLDEPTTRRFETAWEHAGVRERLGRSRLLGSYLVVYPPSGDETEPYLSWRPGAAFEAGYTRIDA